MYDYPPTSEDAQIAGENGFVLSLDEDTRDEEDTAFVTETFELVRIDGDEDDEPIEARGFLVFEPEVVGGVEDNWQVCIETPDDFISYDGTWPDTFSSVEEAIECYRSYFDFGEALEERGFQVA